MNEVVSKFNINFVREVFVLGDAPPVQLIKKLLKGFYYLHIREGAEAEDLSTTREDPHFVIAAVDFADVAKMQELAKLFTLHQSPLAHRIVFVTTATSLSRDQLLFAQEIGARYVCAGSNRNDELKDYVRRTCSDAHQVGSLIPFEAETQAGITARDKPALRRVGEKLRQLPETEDGLRLLATVYDYVNDFRRAEHVLKRLLQINTQNLWAANTLGKLYLQTGRGAMGMEVLQKLSQFHELNGERLLLLGNAQVLAGKTAEAEANFLKGDQLSGGDERFKEGLAKVKLAEKDYQGALKYLGDRHFSEGVISFLNMRAILAIRGGNFAEGLAYYQMAFQGAGEDKDVRAKLCFNLGLAYVRTADLPKAQECFKESCALGGRGFQRAKGPLELVTIVIKNGDKPRPEAVTGATDMMADIEWETMY